MTRKSARDLTFKLLYQADIQKESYNVIFDIANEENDIDENSKKYILNVLNGVESHTDEIEDTIIKKSENWKINRISKISLACLKLGIFELMFNDEIPDTVAINESVNIAKTYEGEESAKFVNGILSVVLKEKA